MMAMRTIWTGGRLAIWTALGLAALALLALTIEGQARGVVSGPAKAKGIAYKGKTSQGKRVTLKVRSGKVVRPSYLIVNRNCGVQFTFTGSSKIRNGRFSFGSRSSNFFKGRLVGHGQVKGRGGIDFTASTCPGGRVTVRFRAHRRR